MEEKSPLRDSINSLLVFHEVVRQKSFSKAAEELFVSQPAVTKHIKGLEQKVGTRLIERGRGRFHLSEAGKILFKSAQKISCHLREAESLLEKFQEGRGGLLRIGTTESYSKCLMPRLLSGFKNAFPSIKIALDVGNSEDIERSLLTYRNDLALIGLTKAFPRFQSIPFLKEELVLIVSPAHPLARRESVSLKELEGYPFIIRAKGSATRKILLQAFKTMDVHPSFLIEAGSSEFIKEWVSGGKGVAVVIKRIVEDEEKRGSIKTIPLLEALNFEVSIVYLKELQSTSAIKAFVHYAKESRKDLIKA